MVAEKVQQIFISEETFRARDRGIQSKNKRQREDFGDSTIGEGLFLVGMGCFMCLTECPKLGMGYYNRKCCGFVRFATTETSEILQRIF